MFVSDKQSSKTTVDSQNKEGDATDESVTSSSSRIGKVKKKFKIWIVVDTIGLHVFFFS